MKFNSYKLLVVFILCLTVVAGTNGQKVKSAALGAVCLEKNYKPKTESELAAMTPRQLIDELVKTNPESFDTYSEIADYETSIDKLVRKAGAGALPVLIDYMNAFEPQSASECEELRFAIVNRTAHDLDRFEFRLRGSKAGQQAIGAFERAIERMEKADKGIIEYRNLFLRELKGVNEADKAIRDTLWILSKIEVSDGELAELSNFLVSRDATYPSWSERSFIKDYSRTNASGDPFQVFTLKKPERYYEAYLQYKKNGLKNATLSSRKASPKRPFSRLTL
jgi:hypothetical protein